MVVYFERKQASRLSVFADGFGDNMGVGLRNQIKSLPVSVTGAGDNVIVAGVAGKVITVVALILVNAVGTTTITVKEGAAINLSGAMLLAQGVPLTLAPDPTVDWYQTLTAGNALVLGLGAATQVSGTVWFIQN